MFRHKPRAASLGASPAALLAATAAIALSAWSSNAGAQDAPPDVAKLPAQLKAVERELEQNEINRDRLQSQAATSARALEAIRTDMISVANAIQDQEHSLTVLESRISDLESGAERLTKTLGRRDLQMVEVLLAIERLALRPSDALTFNPLSPSDAVRSAILLRSALPSIKQSAVTLQGELKDLYRLRAEIIERKEEVAAGAAALLQKRTRLNTLAGEKAEKHEVLLARGEAASQRTAKIAREAEDLRALFARLAEEKILREQDERKLAAIKAAAGKTGAEAAKPADPSTGRVDLRAPSGGEATPKTPGSGSQLAALAPVSPIPAKGDEEAVIRSFTKARGTMPFPVAGTLAGKYGAASQAAGEAGLLAKGITIAGRAGAQVVAPFDGLVAFAGSFRGYGQLLIIEHSEGYHTLLAGLGQIDATVGQRVLAGEPVGVMEKDGASTLYVELRRDGQPINPLPWLADRPGKNSG